jgi:hypothetical protein
MAAVDFRESIGVRPEHSSVTWLRNNSDSLRPASIEPWGSTIYLLPRHEYAVVTESENDDPPAGTSIDVGDSLTVWPEGTRSNRIYRADGNLVWDDANPSQAAIAEHVVSAAMLLISTAPPMSIKLLNRALGDGPRSDLGYLLVEHGLLDMNEQGIVAVPGAI